MSGCWSPTYGTRLLISAKVDIDTLFANIRRQWANLLAKFFFINSDHFPFITNAIQREQVFIS